MLLTYDQQRLFEILKRGKFTKNNCFEWTGGCDKDGYGIASYTPEKNKRKSWKVHRLIYFLTYGEIPKELWVLHKCDNTKCFNLKHLFLGTPSDNSQDREKKARSGNNFESGINNPMCNLTEEMVREIRKMHDNGKKNCEIARQFKLNQGTISKIVLRTRWKHI